MTSLFLDFVIFFLHSSICSIFFIFHFFPKEFYLFYILCWIQLATQRLLLQLLMM